jgi:hypothetical protein
MARMRTTSHFAQSAVEWKKSTNRQQLKDQWLPSPGLRIHLLSINKPADGFTAEFSPKTLPPSRPIHKACGARTQVHCDG